MVYKSCCQRAKNVYGLKLELGGKEEEFYNRNFTYWRTLFNRLEEAIHFNASHKLTEIH